MSALTEAIELALDAYQDQDMDHCLDLLEPLARLAEPLTPGREREHFARCLRDPHFAAAHWCVLALPRLKAEIAVRHRHPLSVDLCLQAALLVLGADAALKRLRRRT